MNDIDRCAPFFDQMAELRQGRLDDGDQQRLFDHLSSCPSCRELLDFHHDLSAASAELDEPTHEEYAQVRGAVLEQIRSRAGSAPATPVFGSRWLAAAAAILLLGTGLFAGRTLLGERAVPADVLIASLEANARSHLSLRDVENSQTSVSNLAVRDLDSNRVRMAFDVTRHLEVERPKDDPLVNELLVHAMLDRGSLGARLKAVSLADSAANGKVHEALVFAMLTDASLPVRLRALDTLATWPRNGAVEGALIRVLLEDSSMQMRLRAVEELAAGGLGRQQILEDLIEQGATIDPAVAQGLLRVSSS